MDAHENGMRLWESTAAHIMVSSNCALFFPSLVTAVQSLWEKRHRQLGNLESQESPRRGSLSPMVEGRNASVDHGLDSKALTDFHLSWHFRVSVVHNAWVVGVELDGEGSRERFATDSGGPLLRLLTSWLIP
jgi:hypothetical protein